MSISLTAAQAAALARVAAGHDAMQLHQVAGSADLLVTTGGRREPDLLIRADGAAESLEATPADPPH